MPCWPNWRCTAISATCPSRCSGAATVASRWPPSPPACTEAAQRGLPLDDPLAEHRWRTPLITTAYAHLEQFAVARAPVATRTALMQRAPDIFRRRWLPLLRLEAAGFRTMLATAIAAADGWQARRLEEAIGAVEAILPNQDFTAERRTLGELRAAA